MPLQNHQPIRILTSSVAIWPNVFRGRAAIRLRRRRAAAGSRFEDPSGMRGARSGEGRGEGGTQKGQAGFEFHCGAPLAALGATPGRRPQSEMPCDTPRAVELVRGSPAQDHGAESKGFRPCADPSCANLEVLVDKSSLAFRCMEGEILVAEMYVAGFLCG